MDQSCKCWVNLHDRKLEVVDDIMTDDCAGTHVLCMVRCERIILQPALIEAIVQPKVADTRDILGTSMRPESLIVSSIYQRDETLAKLIGQSIYESRCRYLYLSVYECIHDMTQIRAESLPNIKLCITSQSFAQVCFL